MNDFQFDFEKLVVYEKTLDFTDRMFEIYKKLSRDYKIAIGSNLIRAALSIGNNLAEGNDKRSRKEKTRYLETACDSTRECVSVLNVLRRQKLVDAQLFTQHRFLAREITSMIKGLIRSL